ncbi:dehydrogenase, partial [Pseudomonas sp. GW704-F2]
MASVRQFWARAGRMRAATRGDYPRNWGYDVMVLTIGASFTAQYALKAAYEDTLGRLTERVSFGAGPGRAEAHMAAVARD